MDVAVVTSCSAKGFKEYGLRFLETFEALWPQGLPLFFVTEDMNEIDLPQLERRPFHALSLTADSPQRVIDYFARHLNNKAARGESSRARPGYDFRLDAWKFSKKVFAINMAMERTQAQRLIWLDADVVTLAQPPMSLLRSMPPEGFALACLDRGRYHSECGFVGYNLKHSQTRTFLTTFQNLYLDDFVFSLKEWHDSYVFDWLRRRSGIVSYRIPHRNPSHPFVYSELGRYMDHLKGNRKLAGKSPEHPRHKPAMERWYPAGRTRNTPKLKGVPRR